MICALLLVLLLNFHLLFTHTDEVTTVRNKIPRKTVVSLMFSNRTFPRAPTYEQYRKSACQWLRGFKKQNKQCEARRGFAGVLQTARQLAIDNCVEQFKYDRWNCVYRKSMFQKIYRETAFMYAISASALMFSTAKACSDGKLQKCYCASRRPRKGNWQWNGCGDNSNKARKIANKFLQLSNGNDSASQILNHNMRVGFKTVKENEMKVCVCHGVLDSCPFKTCWKIIKPFPTIVESLRKKYQSAVKVNNRNNSSAVEKISNKLIFTAHSPNYCENTVGRRCKDREHCATLCCGRGFQQKTESVKERCHCRWQEEYLNVTCKVCTKEVDVYDCV